MLMKKEIKYSMVLLFFISFILVSPQFLTKNMIIGSDSIFHFNRVYETSQQIKYQNFEYFISLYSFQNSGRIVTPLYAPILTYLFGFILLVCGTWFKFQLVVNFLLFFISSTTMYFLLKKIQLSNKSSLALSIIYVTTYATFYWIVRQGFTSWGAAFLPICMIPIVSIVNDKKFQPLYVAMSMSLMFQIHFLSSLMLLIFYIVAFIPYFLKNTKKKMSIKQLFKSIFLFFVLTINVWFSLWRIYGSNKILSPFVNKNIHEATITGSSWYWLINPFALLLIIICVILIIFKNYKNMSYLNQYFSFMSIFFLIMSSNIFPWEYLYHQDMEWINIIQFPFRFFIPAIITLLASFGLSISEKLIIFPFSLNKLTLFTVSMCILQSLILFTQTLNVWNSEENYVVGKKKHFFINGTARETKASFYSKDLEKSLQLAVKSTPDYLPLYDNSTENKYDLYEKIFFDKEQKNKFKKIVKKQEILVEWYSENIEEVTVPIIKYSQTELYYNEKKIKDVDLNSIGNPILIEKKGMNKLRVLYNPISR